MDHLLGGDNTQIPLVHVTDQLMFRILKTEKIDLPKTTRRQPRPRRFVLLNWVFCVSCLVFGGKKTDLDLSDQEDEDATTGGERASREVTQRQDHQDEKNLE